MKNRNFTRFEKTVLISDRATRFVRAPSYFPTKGNISKRGKITGFSRHSALRLRDSLAFLRLKSSSEVFGLTLTVPWKSSYFKLVDRGSPEDLYKICFHRFGVAFRRAFPNSSAIFRHELQQRKMPHTHLVLLLSKLDLLQLKTDGHSLRLKLKRIFFDMWYRALTYEVLGGDPIGFSKFGVKVDKLDGSNTDALYRYICDHASKHKQAQLGFAGKQWGFLKRDNLVSSDKFQFTFKSPYHLVSYARAVRRLSRFFVSSEQLKKRVEISRGKKWIKDHWKYSKVFGRKKSPAGMLRSVNFISLENSLKLARFIDKTFPLESDFTTADDCPF